MAHISREVRAFRKPGQLYHTYFVWEFIQKFLNLAISYPQFYKIYIFNSISILICWTRDKVSHFILASTFVLILFYFHFTAWLCKAIQKDFTVAFSSLFQEVHANKLKSFYGKLTPMKVFQCRSITNFCDIRNRFMFCFCSLYLIFKINSS